MAFVFTGVSSYNISTASLDFEKDEISNERLLPSKKPGKEIIEFVILTTSKEQKMLSFCKSKQKM